MIRADLVYCYDCNELTYFKLNNIRDEKSFNHDQHNFEILKNNKKYPEPICTAFSKFRRLEDKYILVELGNNKRTKLLQRLTEPLDPNRPIKSRFSNIEVTK
jgi:hypothetical protein